MSDPVEDPVLRQRYRFTPEADGMRVDIEVDPGGSVPNHLHPTAQESWEVIEGDVTFKVAAAKHRPASGERIVVAPGVRHSFKNSGQGVALVRAYVKPALDIRGFLEDGAALNRAGKVSRRGLPRSLDGLLAASAFVERYKQTTVLLFGLPAPPRALQRLMTPTLARVHARRGRSAP